MAACGDYVRQQDPHRHELGTPCNARARANLTKQVIAPTVGTQLKLPVKLRAHFSRAARK